MARERLLEVAFGDYKRVEGGRIVVSLVPEVGRARDAYIDPGRIKRVIVTEERPSGGTRWVHYYVVYESDDSFYDKYEHRGVRGSVVREGGMELLREVPDEYIRREGRKWRVWLSELEEWDSYLWDFSTAVSILETNVHPYLGVMD